MMMMKLAVAVSASGLVWVRSREDLFDRVNVDRKIRANNETNHAEPIFEWQLDPFYLDCSFSPAKEL